MDWSSFVPDVLAGIVAGAVVLGGGYWLIDRKVHFRDALERRAEREAGDARNRGAALEALHAELESNASALAFALKTLRGGTIGYPLFDTTTLAVAFEPVIFTTLKTTTVKALLQVFNRMKTANDQHALVFDLQQGQTVILNTMIHAVGADTPRAADAAANFLEHRTLMLKALLQRCENLAPYVYEAIDAVEAELGTERRERAADREYVAAEPIGYIGDDVGFE